MQAIVAPPRTPQDTPLTSREELWTEAVRRAHEALVVGSKSGAEPTTQPFLIAAVAAKLGDGRAADLLGLVRRILFRSTLGGEVAIRCLRTLARAGARVDVQRLSEALGQTGRVPRMALAALAEEADRGSDEALHLIATALDGILRADAAMFLSHLATDEALDALATHLRTPGTTGIHAATALVSAEDDPFAFEVLCERLCDPSDGVLAARALWGAAPEGRRLREAESALARWARRGVKSAEAGRSIAACVLTAGGFAQDVGATLRALTSEDDEIALLGAQAAFSIGDAERAHGAAVGLLRRGPLIAGQAFALLARWADVGDERASTLVKNTLERRPIDLARAAVFEALGGAVRPVLHGVVARALTGNEPIPALEAARALAKLKEPPAIIPPLWL